MTLERMTKAPAEGEIYYDYLNDRDIMVITIDQKAGMALCKISEYETDQDGEINTKDWHYENYSIDYLEMLKIKCA
ncbi:MAG: hypothetical protein J6Q34_00700 [Bacteroidales bacterium]|nr:hypothetical protein [Bacteroidales bacterium]